MVKLQITACDKCGAKEGTRAITPWTARRGTSRYSGDLCEKCWEDLLKNYKPTSLAKGRHTIAVTDIDEIPKNA